MGSLPQPPLQPTAPSEGRTLKVDFSWKKFKALITDKSDPQSTPLYITDYKVFKISPKFVFTSAANGSTFATGTLHPVSINPDCEIRGRPITIKALRRLKTSYTHLSSAFSTNGEPVPMTWASRGGFTTWDFICLDAQQNPVAKFSAKTWALTKIGYVEFMGPRDAISDEMVEEILVTGMTLFYCMVLRTNNILNLFGAIFSRPGHEKKAPAVAERESDGTPASTEVTK
jgi:hypothetical protein